MPFSDLSLLAVFMTGLLGGVHCAGMCGGIVSALGMMQQKSAGTVGGIPVSSVQTGQQKPVNAGPGALTTVSLYNIGRITMYSILGTLAGAVGSVVWLMETLLPVQQIAFFISSVLVILMGLYVIGIRQIGVVMETAGEQVWKRVRPFATRRLTGAGKLNSLLAGGLWGMVPCGMVYAVLGAALVSGGAVNGGLLMLVFGLGTLPNLMLLGLSGQWLAKASRHKTVRLLAGLVIVSFGVMGLMHLSMMLGQ